ncbi:MAG: hypothetical protein H6511_02745 [Holophagales bacterium]|nr:hypothetical protein [Holophagales bacterium]
MELDLLDAPPSSERRHAIVRAWIGAAAAEARQTHGAPPGTVVQEASDVDLEEALEEALAASIDSVGGLAELSVEEIHERAARLAGVASHRGLLVAANVAEAPESPVLFALADLAHREALADPARGTLLGRLVLALAQRCPDARDRLAADLEAAAWIAIADGLDRASDVVEAEAALEMARRAREAGTADPLLDARFETVASNLRYDQSRYREALAHARRARRIYAEIGQPHEAAKARIRIAIQLYHLGEPLEAAIRELERAIPQLRSDHEPRAYVAAYQAMTRYLAEDGKLDEAEHRLHELRKLGEGLTNPHDLARIEWLAAHIAALRGDYGESERLYRNVVDFWTAEGVDWDTAIATLELTGVLLAQGRTEEVRRNAEQLLPVFRNLGLAPEAIATLQLVTAAARRDALEHALLEKLVAQLRGRPPRPVRGA